jgi:glycosyltransferase involved in cell wall biosynthesis
MLEVARPEISVVIPCRNEEENAGPIANAVIKQLEQAGSSFEIIFIDNHSSDRTVEVIRELCSRDKRIKLIVNTRNFGQMCSPTHGIFQARGRAVIGMSADFEDPPELITTFVEKWRAGAFIVLGVSEAQQVGPIHRAVRRLSYKLQRTFGDQAIVPNATGFGLYDAAVVRSIRSLREPEPFFRAMLVETGYPIETVTYSRRARAAGVSNNNFFTLLDFALNGLANSSKNLLRAPLYVAFISGVLTFFGLVGAVFAALAGWSVQLWLLAAAMQGQFTLLFLFLGLIGAQIRQISERTRGTPLVIEKERLNFTDG